MTKKKKRAINADILRKEGCRDTPETLFIVAVGPIGLQVEQSKDKLEEQILVKKYVW